MTEWWQVAVFAVAYAVSFGLAMWAGCWLADKLWW